MSAKQYLKMADAFVHDDVASLEQHIYAGYMSMHCCEYAAHAIDSHDELVAENERLREELAAALCEKQRTASIPDGWQLVPVEPTFDMQKSGSAFPIGDDDLNLVDMSFEEIRCVYKAMLSAAPKHEGGAS